MFKKYVAYLVVCMAVFFTACTSTKKIIYLQDVVPLKQQEIEQKYEVIIHGDDLLAIMVNSRDPELALPFNMPMVSYQLGSNTGGQQRVLGYLVDTNGNIDFPILGEIHVEGFTRMQLTELIKNKLIEGDLIKDPIVTVQFLNFKISVMGEVGRPGSFTISGDRITLLEALSMAGDLTIYGNRKNVLLIRDNGGKKEYHRFDLTSIESLNSPYYYLQQNDVLYVEPNKARKGNAKYSQSQQFNISLASTVISAISVLASLAIALLVK